MHACLTRHGKQPIRCIPSEIEDGPGRTRRQEQPRTDTDRVLTRQRLPGKFEVAAVACQQQDSAQLWLLDERAAGSAQSGVKLIPRGVLGIAVEHVAGNQTRFTDAVEELVAALPLFGHDVGKRQKDCRQSEEACDKCPGDHWPFHFVTPNVKTVWLWYSAPGRRVVVGNFGLFGESGKCCV